MLPISLRSAALELHESHRLERSGPQWSAPHGSESLRFITADGRTIPRAGYRLDDFVDDVGDAGERPSVEGSCTTPVQSPFESHRTAEQSVSSEGP